MTEDKIKGHYFKKIDGKYKCVRCNHPLTSFMGIMSHIRKHKIKRKVDKMQLKLYEEAKGK